MTDYYYVESWTNRRTVVNIANGTSDNIIIGVDAHMVSTEFVGIWQFSGAANVYIDGSVHGGQTGITLGPNGPHEIVISSTGLVASDAVDFAAIDIFGDGSSVVNHGTIENLNDGGSGIAFSGATFIYNTGTISAQTEAITTLDGTKVLRVVNTGTITGSNFTVVSGDDADKIYNTGTLNGTVSLNGGDNVYVGSGGSVTGGVSGTSGNDSFIGGAFSETFLAGRGANWLVGGGDDDAIAIGVDTMTDTIFAGDVDGTDNSTNDTIGIDDYLGANVFLGGGYISQAEAGQPSLPGSEQGLKTR